jgi:hypothetical protein
MTDFPSPADLPKQDGLIDPFLRSDGTRVGTSEEWSSHRDELIGMLQHYIYGHSPERPERVDVTVEAEEEVYGGKANQKLVALACEQNGCRADLRVGLIVPAGSGPYPLVIKNDTYRFDMGEVSDVKKRKQFADERQDDVEASIFEEAVNRGYAICKFVRTDWADDTPDSKDRGIYPLYPECDWGAIAVWAWTFSVLIDWLESHPSINTENVIVTGHSRGGKTALAAGILDDRICVTAPNSSGGGGTGSYRVFKPGLRQQGVANQLKSFPYWWHPRFYEFAEREDYLPFDAHTLKALVAPRLLFNAHALQDDWANPYGTQFTYEAAQSVYEFLGTPERQGIHWREGGHAQSDIDWMALLDFCDVHVRGVARDRSFDALPFEYSDEHRTLLSAYRALFQG